MALSKIRDLVDSLKSLDDAERAQLEKELERQDFKMKRMEKDKSIAINILKATISDLEKNQAVTRAANEQLSEQKKIIENNTHLLEENLRKLEQSYRELQQFSYIVSHDLKSPLRTISSFAQILKATYQDELPAEANEYVDLIISGTFRMDSVIQALLNFARVGNRGEAKLRTDLNAVVEMVKLNLKKEIEDQQAQIHYTKLPVIVGNKTALLQLFQNLISNALKFRSEACPQISITHRAVDGGWEFRFKDNGVGIDEQYREKIFLPFKRLSERKLPGIGIGLAICKKVVKMHQGEIRVEAAEDGGAVFIFTLMSQEKTVEQPEPVFS